MSECYVGEIRIWSSPRIPQNWALCNGQKINIADNEILYSLIGSIYGGDGRTYFNLPNLQGMLPIGQGQGVGLTSRTIGQIVGAETVALTDATLPAHNHTLFGSTSTANATVPDKTMVLGAPANPFYAPYGTDPKKIMALNDVAVTPYTNINPLPHENMMPATPLNYIIALQGNYPSQN